MNHAEGPHPSRSPYPQGLTPGSGQAISAGSNVVVRALQLAVLALLLLVLWLALLLAAAWVPLDAPLQPTERIRHPGAEFQLLAGTGGETKSDRIRGITALGPDHVAMQARKFETPIEASGFPVLRYRWKGFPQTLELSFMFRRADAPDDVRTITLPPAGRYPGYFDLRDVPAWRGRITEIGFAQYPTAQLVPANVEFQPYALEEAELWSPSWRGSLGVLRTDWLAYRPWALMSISALGPDAPWPHKLSPVIVLALGLFASALLCVALLGRATGRIGRSLCIALGIGWLVLDLRWLVDFNERNALTRELHGGRPWHERAAIVPDLDLVAAAQQVRDLLGRAPANTRVVVAADTAYTMLRLDYHLLPSNAAPVTALDAQPPTAWAAPIWLVAYAARDWRFDASKGVLHGPSAAYAANVVFENDDLQVYHLLGAPR